MTFDRTKRSAGDINITPLIDMVFLLIIFFLLTSSFIRDTGIKINLPDAASVSVHERNDITVSILGNGKIFLDGKEVKIETLENILKAEYIRKNLKTVTVKSDKDNTVEILIDVIDIINKSGAETLTIAADKKGNP